MCVVLDHGAAYSDADHVLQAAVKGNFPFRWLTPPKALGDVTIADVRAAISPDEYIETIHAWARRAWGAWADHHDTVRTWVAGV